MGVGELKIEMHIRPSGDRIQSCKDYCYSSTVMKGVVELHVSDIGICVRAPAVSSALWQQHGFLQAKKAELQVYL